MLDFCKLDWRFSMLEVKLKELNWHKANAKLKMEKYINTFVEVF